jgi:Rieske Fe-S protein
MTDSRTRGAIDRRHVLAVGLGTAGLAGLAACGDGSTGTNGSPYGGGAAAPATSAPASGAGDATTGPAAGATPLIALADVPVGSAASATTADGKPVIVAQPTAGTAVAFSAICTHRGCTVAPAGSELKCPCHGSVYKASDGSNVSGPAPRPLDKVAVKVVDGQVVPG